MISLPDSLCRKSDLLPLFGHQDQPTRMCAITKQQWGTTSDGEQVDLFTLRNSAGIEAAITNYGGRLVSLKLPDREGKFADVVLGFDDLKGYLAKNPYFGALVGRYANRIAGATFALEGKQYQLARNNGENSLHGGPKGFDKVAWKARTDDSSASALDLTYLSKAGEEGFPGNLEVKVRYTLSDDNKLRLDYQATTDAATVVNLTNHSYFNLSGEPGSSILDHQVMIAADQYTPSTSSQIPTGEFRVVARTPFDFRSPSLIGSRIDEKDQQLEYGMGYDHNFVLNHQRGELSFAASVKHPRSGRSMEVSTTQPGLQLYTANHLDGSVIGKSGAVYGPRCAICFETQHFPDSPNRPEFPSSELKPGQTYRQVTVFRFSTD